MAQPAHRPPPLDLHKTPIVATIFYKSQSPRHPILHPDSPSHKPGEKLPEASLNALTDGAVPTKDLSKYPLEPPPPGPDPLDHLYGSYISQSCLTDFYQTLNDLIPEFDEKKCSHRNLDLTAEPRVVEVTFFLPLSSQFTISELHNNEVILRFEHQWNVEAVFQSSTVWRRYKRLAIFDMDSTLIQQEVIDEIAREIGVEEQVSAITAAAMNGELDFEASLRARCALLKGVSSDVWETLKSRIVLNHGAAELVRALKKLGFKTAVLSGGFTPLAGWLAGILGLDYFFANHLAVSEDQKVLTGEVIGDIVHAERKRQLLIEIAAKEGIPIEQVLAVGDGANDLPMMKASGLGVAFNAKARVQMEAPARLNSKSLLDILYLFGISKEEQEDLLR